MQADSETPLSPRCPAANRYPRGGRRGDFKVRNGVRPKKIKKLYTRFRVQSIPRCYGWFGRTKIILRKAYQKNRNH